MVISQTARGGGGAACGRLLCTLAIAKECSPLLASFRRCVRAAFALLVLCDCPGDCVRAATHPSAGACCSFEYTTNDLPERTFNKSRSRRVRVREFREQAFEISPNTYTLQRHNGGARECCECRRHRDRTRASLPMRSTLHPTHLHRRGRVRLCRVSACLQRCM